VDTSRPYQPRHRKKNGALNPSLLEGGTGPTLAFEGRRRTEMLTKKETRVKGKAETPKKTHPSYSEPMCGPRSEEKATKRSPSSKDILTPGKKGKRERKAKEEKT